MKYTDHRYLCVYAPHPIVCDIFPVDAVAVEGRADSRGVTSLRIRLVQTVHSLVVVVFLAARVWNNWQQ